MLPPVERTSFDYSLLFLAALSIILGLFVLWLILTKSAESLRDYRFYLCGITFCDLAFAFVVGFVIEPDPWMPTSLGTAVKGLGRYLGTDNAGRLVFSMAAFTLASQLMFQMYSMVFRYIIVMSQRFPSAKELLLKSTTKLAIFVSILATASLVSTMSFCAFDDQFTQFWCQLYYRPNDGFNWTSPALFQNRSAEMDAILTDPPFVNYLNRTSPELAKRIVTNIRSMHLTPEQLLVLDAIHREMPMIYPAWGAALPMLLAVGCILTGIFLLQIVCIVMGVSIIRYLRKNAKSFQRQTYKLDMQLIVLLIIQMIEPLLCIALPVCYACYGLLLLVLQLDLPFPGLNQNGMRFGIVLFTFYPTLNSLLTMLFVSSYRKFLIKILRLESLAKWLGIFEGINTNQVVPLQRTGGPAVIMYPPMATKSG